MTKFLSMIGLPSIFQYSNSGYLTPWLRIKRVVEFSEIALIDKNVACISAAGGVGLIEARSTIFNGANIVAVNLVRPGDPTALA